MKKMNSTLAVKSLAALAQESRLTIFRRLVQAGPEGLTAGQLAETLGTVLMRAFAPFTLSTPRAINCAISLTAPPCE